ncbi:hypothetical protein KUTeg_010548 [Tegillarca granosa]|uniref:Uncharacterized protein n=1 Tax=Tegillarca granosa TaxID=220873 RepID=A0ABQ9F3C0_TEGGR|nr:hypothetical protein KUTeg_010548 [Tegillarca granosa]
MVMVHHLQLCGGHFLPIGWHYRSTAINRLYKACHSNSVDQLPHGSTCYPKKKADNKFSEGRILCKISKQSANKKLYKLEQTQMETTTQYLDRVQCLAFNAQDMTEESIVGLAVEGLLPKYKSCVLSHDPKTFSSLRNALEIASAVAECNPQINALNSMTELVQAIKEIKEEVKNIKTPSFQPVTQPPLPPAFHGYHMPPPISRPAQQFHHQPQAQMKTCNGCGSWGVILCYILLSVMVVTASAQDRIVQRLNYGVIFKEISSIQMGQEYWTHTFELELPKQVTMPPFARLPYHENFKM